MSSSQFNGNGFQSFKNNQNLRKYRPLAPRLPLNPMVNNLQVQQKASSQLAPRPGIQVLPKPNIPVTETAKMSTQMLQPRQATQITNGVVENTDNIIAVVKETSENDVLFQNDFLSYDSRLDDPQYQINEQENLLVSILKFNFYN